MPAIKMSRGPKTEVDQLRPPIRTSCHAVIFKVLRRDEVGLVSISQLLIEP